MLPDSLAYYGSTEIYWHAIILAAALLGGIVTAWLFRVAQLPWKRGDKGGMWLVTALALVFGFFISRGMYCYFKPETVENGSSDFFNISKGGMTLYGAIFGTLLAVLVVKLVLRKKVKAAELLDALSPAAALAICVGRCASYFSHEDIGQVMEIEKLRSLPFAVYDVTDGYWHTAVFSFEALAAAAAFIISVIVFVICYGRGTPIGAGRPFAAFTFVFTAAQCLFESMRTDSVYLRLLGFVRFNQAFSAIVLFGFFIWMAVSLIKKTGFKIWMAVMWAVVAGCFALAFYKEFRLTSGTLVKSHIIMGVCLATICLCGLVLMFMSMFAKKKPEESEPAALVMPETPALVSDIKEQQIAEPEPAVQENAPETIPEAVPTVEEPVYSTNIQETSTENYNTYSDNEQKYSIEDLEAAYLKGSTVGDYGYSRPTEIDPDKDIGFGQF